MYRRASYSATAPQFLPEQERYERSTLTREEWNEIHKDIQGISGRGSNTHNRSNSNSDSGSDSSLSLAQRADEEDDDDDKEENGARIALSCQLLHEAMEELGPLQKGAYLDACTKVPELVEKETNPLSFLRGEKFNASVSRF
jgi:hypothetical protein